MATEQKIDQTKVEQPKNELDIKTINESLSIVLNSLDKATLKGSFALDEAYNVKIAISNITKIIELLIKKVAELSNHSNQQSLISS